LVASVDERDLYQLLGVANTATQEEVREAYRRLIRLTHPDVGGTDMLFRQVKEAYDTLSDPDRRAEYDRKGSGPRFDEPVPPPPNSGWVRVDTVRNAGPTSSPPPPETDPHDNFTQYTPPGDMPHAEPSHRWDPPGGPVSGSQTYPDPSTGPAPSDWYAQPSPPPAEPARRRASPSGSFWRVRPWLIPVLLGAVLILFGSKSAQSGLLGVLLLGIGLLAAAGSRRVRARMALRHSQVVQADYMDGTTFEFFAAEVLRANGYRVDHVGQVGDYGADLIISNPAGRAVVQVKRYSRNVGVDAVREAATARAHYATNGAIVLTNSYFTHQAVALARSNAVELWDRDTLVRLASQNLSVRPAAAVAVLALELAAGMAIVGRLLVAAIFSSGRRSRTRRRRR